MGPARRLFVIPDFYFFFFVLDLLERTGAAFFRPADFFAVDFVAAVALAMIVKPL